MKKIYYCLIATFALMLSACQSTLVDDLSVGKIEAMTRSAAATSWDASSKCVLLSGAKVALPWATETVSTIPDAVRTDVKESDGWKVLYSSVNFDGCPITVTAIDK